MNILTSLRRLLKREGYTIFIAQSAQEGLSILERQAIDLILSDMRMPVMDGAVFLEKVSEDWPDSIRILLTGYSDLSATISAVTKGRIYKYISKPWEEQDLLLTIRHALDRKYLEQERQRLAKLTLKQNMELKELNKNLEKRVEEQTEELRQAMGRLEKTHESLKKNYFSTIRVFSDLIEMREGSSAGHARRVADLSRKVAQNMGLSSTDAQNSFIAGLLHGIGKIALSDQVINKPLAMLSAEEMKQYRKYAILGESILLELDNLQPAARIIRSHLEHYDGSGFPDRLAGNEIPIGARILAGANDYEFLRNGLFSGEKLSHKDALKFLEDRVGSRYDPDVVETLAQLPSEWTVYKKL
jgi:response regulator RpfG family c-di-GMP phosphodiesterase